MAISRTPALFARVDLFSRSRVILFTRNNFQLPTKTPLEMTATLQTVCKLQLLREVSRVTDGLLDKFAAHKLMMIANKAKYPNRFETLSADLKISDPLQEVFSIPYNAADETYVWSFQYKLLNNILFTNTKLFKIGLIESEKCSFCTIYKEDLYHLFYDCSNARTFWNRFCKWWSNIRSENLGLSLKDVIVGILNRNDLLNYLIILGKLCIW